MIVKEEIVLLLNIILNQSKRRGLGFMCKKSIKNNNTGFTLLEVLVAVIILAVVSVPLLRSFATAAQTNRKSKIEEKCTTAAENVFESFRDVPVEELINKFDIDDDNKVEYDADDETYTFTIKDQNLIGSNMPEGYYATVTLDPRYYKNANELNLASIEPVSIKDSAIYTMDAATGLPDTLASYHCKEDTEAYDWFYNRNIVARTTGSYSSLGDTQQEAWSNLRVMLSREIKFTVLDVGDWEVLGDVPEPEEGEEAEPAPVEDKYDLVTVNMTITYRLVGQDGKYFPIADNEYIAKQTVLFDNTSNHEKMRAVYLFFYPRYSAGKVSGSERDKIIVDNSNNIDFNFYVTAMEGADNPENKSIYMTNGGLTLEVIENNPDVATNPAHVTLRTNLNDGAPYSKSDTHDGKVQMTLKYKTNNIDVKKSGQDAAKFLNAGNLDGKTLDKNNTQKRIYKIIVDIYDNSVPPEGAVKSYILRFDGTKLEY